VQVTKDITSTGTLFTIAIDKAIKVKTAKETAPAGGFGVNRWGRPCLYRACSATVPARTQ